jgi:hypothetical protein
MNCAAFAGRLGTLALFLLSSAVSAQTPAGTAFTYQGRLMDNGAPANGPYDLGFSLFGAPSGGTALGTNTLPAVPVSQGLFTVKLDFGVAPFVAGQARWLEIQVTPPGGPVLSPRQELTPSPYTLFSSYTDPANLTSLNASNLTSGVVPGARLSGTYSQPLSLTNPANAVTGTLAGNGAAVTGLNASNLASGTVPGARLAGTYANAITFSSPGNFFTGDGSGLTNLNAQPPYVRTVVVRPVGSATANGTALLNALAGITTASATNPWLLKIEPGIYDVGAGSLVMKPFVDVEGSGETATRITGTGHAANNIGTVQAVTNSELRFVTVESVGGAFAKAVYVSNAQPRISHVTVLASAATTESQGLFSDLGAVATVSDLTAFVTASGAANSFGVMEIGSSNQLFHVTASTNGGAFSRALYVCCGGTPTFRNSFGVASGASSENMGFAIYDSSPNLEYVTAIATGPAVNNLGVLMAGATTAPQVRYVACRALGANNFNWGCLANFSSQPTLFEIDAFGNGGTLARGIEIDGAGAGVSLSRARAVGAAGISESRGLKVNNCSPRIVNLEAFANGSGSSTVYGVHLVASSSDMSHVTSTAGGDATVFTAGVRLEGAGAPTLSHVTSLGAGAGQSFGLFNTATGNPSVRDSVFSAAGTGIVSTGSYSDQAISLVNITTRTFGTQQNYGAYFANPPAGTRLVNGRVVGNGGTGGWGLLVEGAGTVNVDRSTLSGDVNSIFLFNNATVRVAVSQLINPVNPGAGTLSCLTSYNGAYNPLNAACQ